MSVDYCPRDHRGWYSLGQIYELLGADDYAVEYYSRAAALTESERIFVRLGECYIARGQLEQGLKCLQKASMFPEATPSIHLKIGHVYAQMQYFDKSLEHFRRWAASLNPSELRDNGDMLHDAQVVVAAQALAQDEIRAGHWKRAAFWRELLQSKAI